VAEGVGGGRCRLGRCQCYVVLVVKVNYPINRSRVFILRFPPVPRYIGTIDTSQNDNPGRQFMLGGTNISLYTFDITYTPVIQPAKWWLISLSSVGTQGGSSIDVAQNASYSIIDTGTTLVGGHDIVVDGIFSGINGSIKGETIASQMTRFYAVPCDTTFTFSSTTFTVSSCDLLYMADRRPATELVCRSQWKEWEEWEGCPDG